MISRLDSPPRPARRPGAHASLAAAILVLATLPAAAFGALGRHVPGQVLVRYRDGAAASARATLESSIGAHRVASFAIAPIHLLQLEDGADVERAVARLSADPGVAWAEPNYRIRAAALAPNDPLFPSQEALRNTGQTGGVTGADVHALQAWDTYTGDPSLRVGVLDTGIDVEHPDLVDNLWVNEDELRGLAGLDDDANGYVDDLHGFNVIDGIADITDFAGHGTQVAGIIGAVGNNGRGIAGLSWRCRLLGIKVMRSGEDGSVASVVGGIQYAAVMGVRIACSSWTVDSHSQALLDAIDAAGLGGMLFVSAAGNEGLDLDVTPRYPAAFDSPYVLDAAASTPWDSLADFSNYGANTVDIAAPGIGVLTTQPGQFYVSPTGTSMAAALVAGTCALVAGRYAGHTNLQIKDLVIQAADVRPALTGKVRTNGRLNAARSVSDPDLTAPGTITDLAILATGSNTMTLGWTAPGDDSTTGVADAYELRWSTSPITQASFAAGTLVPTPRPAAAGAAERVTVTGLQYSTTYHFAVRTSDEEANLTPISNVASGTTAGAPSIAVTPSALGVGLVSGAARTETFQIANSAPDGTLDFVIPPPSLGALTVVPDSGSVAAGQSVTIEVRFDASGLPGGGTRADLEIRSNDPARPVVTMPVDLWVVGAPDLHVAPASLDFDTVTVGAAGAGTITLANRGPHWLRVTRLASAESTVTVPTGPLDVPPGGSRSIPVEYRPRTAGALAGAVRLWSNDPDAPHRVVPVAGVAVTPPAIDVVPDSVHVELFSNLETTTTVRVANRGQATLHWEATVLYPDSVAGRPGAPALGAPRGARLERTGGPDRFGYTFIDSDSPHGPTFDWIDVRAGGTLLPMVGDDASSGPHPIGFTFPFYGNRYSSFRVSTNGFLSLTSSSTAYHNLPLPTPDAPRTLIAPLWDDLAFSGTPSVWIRGDSLRLVVQYVEVPRYAEDNPNTFQAILHRDGRIVFQYLSIQTPNPDSCTVGIQNASGTDGLQIAYSEPYVRSGLAVRIQPPRQFLTVTPERAIVAGGDSVDLVLRLTAAGLFEGDYRAVLRLDSNDPLRPRLDVPVSLRVRGSALAAIEPDTLEFGDVYVGHPRSRSFVVQNVGTGRLDVAIASESPEFQAVPTALSLAPATRDSVHVTLSPAAAGDLVAALMLTTNDPSQPSIRVHLEGRGLQPPDIVVTPDSLVAEAGTPANPAERIVTRLLVLENRGAGDLVWSAAPVLGAPAPATITARAPLRAPSSPALEKGAPDVSGPPVLARSGGPDAFGYEWIDSDEPGGPAFAWIDIAGIGTRIPFVRDDQGSGPLPLPFRFEFYGVRHDSVRVCTNGWLSFTSRDTAFANVRLPNAGHRAPENLIAPFWDDLDLRRGGRVYVHGDSSRFVVSFLEAPHWTEPSAPPSGVYSFQAVLLRSGEIHFQYLDVEGLVTSATIGIQNAAKDDGLTIAFNTPYVHDRLRVKISRLVEWLIPTPASGTIAAGESDTIEVRFDATELSDGDYFGVLEIASNDPDDRRVVVPVRLRVGAGASAAPAAPSAVSTAVDVPRKFEFSLAGRHPAHGVARFELALPAASAIELAVFDVRGARVRRFAVAELPAGRHTLAWDGETTTGRRAGPGVYFVRVRAGSWQGTRRVTLVR